MKKILLICLVAVTLPAMAQDISEASGFDYPYLVFTDTEGNEQAFAAEGLSMTIEKGGLVVVNSEKTTEVSLENLSKMYFSETEPTATGIETKSFSQPLQEARKPYYDLTGRRVVHPAKGLYIVNGKKIIVK